MRVVAIAILLISAGVVAVMLIMLPFRRPRVHMIDTADLMRLEEAREHRSTGQRRRARWVVMAIGLILLASLFWGLAN